ncbi:DUF2273 domain-containing protein [Desulfosporosinus sp.]|uniref:DUF2273 domain-containing protein n=1 Tax=Desulfosporosinus sp. TaxID=157907 RepID=UPI000E9FD69C|nr:DUF2273 domain-containing protein [Desulfosporosinus sp.]MBC2722365.1 DUF2273 domain-containing protein [Desulfosporosinus sp.]MBC2726861.1 DUF2273 domain-containing protein [Desulfosporosinus sp.]HBV89063.1 hypothetical protein [Desulfosporosinus sp.]
MSGFWSKVGAKISTFLVWALDSHPGKFLGTSLGFLLGLLLVTLGFWRTLVVTTFSVLGFFLGKRQDDYKDISTWFEKTFNKF